MTDNNLIHREDIYGNEMWIDHDEEGRLIYAKDADGYERWLEYIEGYVHITDSSGFDAWFLDTVGPFDDVI